MMSKRLQVLLDEEELDRFRAIADAERTTLAEWVRRALRRQADDRSPVAPERKRAALQAATRHAFPAPDIDEMSAEIAAGYGTMPST